MQAEVQNIQADRAQLREEQSSKTGSRRLRGERLRIASLTPPGAPRPAALLRLSTVFPGERNHDAKALQIAQP